MQVQLQCVLTHRHRIQTQFSFPRLRLPHPLACLPHTHALIVTSGYMYWLQQSAQHTSALCPSQQEGLLLKGKAYTTQLHAGLL